MKSFRPFLFLGLFAMLAFNTACSQFFSVPPTPTQVPALIPTITPILIIMPSPTSAQIPTATRIATLVPASSASSSAVIIPTSTQPINRISFPPGGTNAVLNGTVAANGLDRYVLRAQATQVMSVSFTPGAENLSIQVSGADGSVLASGAKLTTGVFNLPQTQDYFITVLSSSNVETKYIVEVTVYPLGTSMLVTPTLTPRRITFATGAISATVHGKLAVNDMDRWVIRVQAGQTMTAKAIPQNGNVMVIVFGVDGDVYQTDHVGSPDFFATLQTTQDYYIDVRAWGDTAPTYTLQVTIPPK